MNQLAVEGMARHSQFVRSVISENEWYFIPNIIFHGLSEHFGNWRPRGLKAGVRFGKKEGGQTCHFPTIGKGDIIESLSLGAVLGLREGL